MPRLQASAITKDPAASQLQTGRDSVSDETELVEVAELMKPPSKISLL